MRANYEIRFHAHGAKEVAERFAAINVLLEAASKRADRRMEDECHHCGAPSPREQCRYCGTACGKGAAHRAGVTWRYPDAPEVTLVCNTSGPIGYARSR